MKVVKITLTGLAVGTVATLLALELLSVTGLRSGQPQVGPSPSVIHSTLNERAEIDTSQIEDRRPPINDQAWVDALMTCERQTAVTVPTWAECIANQFEHVA